MVTPESCLPVLLPSAACRVVARVGAVAGASSLVGQACCLCVPLCVCPELCAKPIAHVLLQISHHSSVTAGRWGASGRQRVCREVCLCSARPSRTPHPSCDLHVPHYDDLVPDPLLGNAIEISARHMFEDPQRPFASKGFRRRGSQFLTCSGMSPAPPTPHPTPWLVDCLLVALESG